MYTYPTDTKDLLSSLTDSHYFSALDLKNAFYQVSIHKDSIKYFGISTSEGIIALQLYRSEQSIPQPSLLTL